MRTYCQAQVTSCHYPLNINKCIIIWWIDKALNWIKLTKGVATRSSLYWRHRYDATSNHLLFNGGGGQPVCPNLCMQHMVKIYPRLEPVPTFPIFPLLQIFSRRVAVERILDDDSQDVSPLSTLLSWIKRGRRCNGGMRRKQLLKMNRWQRSLRWQGLFVMITPSELFVELVIYYPCHNSFINRV